MGGRAGWEGEGNTLTGDNDQYVGKRANQEHSKASRLNNAKTKDSGGRTGACCKWAGALGGK